MGAAVVSQGLAHVSDSVALGAPTLALGGADALLLLAAEVPEAAARHSQRILLPFPLREQSVLALLRSA